MKYLKKPVVIDAMVFEDSGEQLVALQEFMGGRELRVNYEGAMPKLWVETLEGGLYADKGDYIIKGIKGEFYPCKPDIFALTYEEADYANG